MFDTVLAYATNGVVVGTVGLTLGVVFGQKIKDFLSGVPAEARTAAEALATKTKNDLKTALSAAKADVLSKITPVAVKPPVPVAPVAPIAPAPVAPAPVAPAPAAAPVVAVVVPVAPVEPAAHA